MVVVDGVSCRFGDVHAVDRASFHVGRGRFLTILGPSGSGKTTLLRMIAGFVRPDAGEIYLHGEPVSARPPHRRSIGMVFQRLALFPHLDVHDNVAYPLRMRRFDPATIGSRVERVLSVVRLEGLGRRSIQALSGGQQQRVAIARALVFEPDLLLLDEPLAALDRHLREEMQLEFRRIQQALGVTTINVTHDQRGALVMSDDVVVMDGGRIQRFAAPADTYLRPANAFVAGFLGVTNAFEAVVEAAPGGPVLRAGAASGPLPPGSGALPGEAVDCAVRAERIRLHEGAPGDADWQLQGSLRQVLFEGDRVLFEVAVEALGGLVFRVLDRGDPGSRPWRPGDAVTLTWRAGDLWAFPRAAAFTRQDQH